MRILKFQASWCVPCKNLTKTMQSMDIPFHVEEVDIDKDINVSILYGVRAVPTLIMLDDHDNIVRRANGNMTKDQLKEWMTQ